MFNWVLLSVLRLSAIQNQKFRLCEVFLYNYIELDHCVSSCIEVTEYIYWWFLEVRSLFYLGLNIA